MMIFVGMWACQHRELRPITFTGLEGSSQAQSSQQNTGDGQQESSFGRGRGRERSLQNDFEMDRLKASGQHPV